MPILNLDDVPQSTTPTTPKFRSHVELGTAELFNTEIPVDTIRYQVDGMPWTIEYFSQILGINQEPIMPDINVPETTLSYNRIEKLDIYVDSGLPTSVVTDITGTGIINAGFVPSYGDAFIATVAGGRIAIFTIEKVTRQYYNTHNIYTVEFKLSYFADTSADIYNDLMFKTVRTYVYDKEAITRNSVPIILSTEYTRRLNLEQEPNKILNYYLDTFYNKDTKFLQLPTVNSNYVDQLVTSVIFSLSSINDIPELMNISRLPAGIESKTVWDALFTQDLEQMLLCEQKIHFGINVSSISTSKIASYLGINYTVTDNPNIPTVTPNVKTNPLSSKKVVPAPLSTPVDAYVFSTAFYDQTNVGNYTGFETLVMAYLTGDIPDRAVLEKTLTEYRYWGYLEQYYLLPVLVMIVKYTNLNNYSPV